MKNWNISPFCQLMPTLPLCHCERMLLAFFAFFFLISIYIKNSLQKKNLLRIVNTMQNPKSGSDKTKNIHSCQFKRQTCNWKFFRANLAYDSGMATLFCCAAGTALMAHRPRLLYQLLLVFAHFVPAVLACCLAFAFRFGWICYFVLLFFFG